MLTAQMVILQRFTDGWLISTTTLELYPLKYPIRHKDLTKRTGLFYSLGGITGAIPNGTKLRGIVVKRAACLPAKSAKFPIKRHLAQPLRQSNMLNLVPLGAIPVFMVWILAVLLLISSGITYRVLASRLQVVVDTPVILPVPLSAFPRQIGDWTGQDVPIPVNIQQVAGNDAFLNRLFVNKSNNQWVNVYIAYTAHPRTMLGHRPQACYVAGGWVHEGTERSNVTTGSGREFPCLIHRFHRPAPETEETVVLNFYIVNGRLTSDERVFSGVGWRTPNIDGNPARYVTQVQISSVFENSIRAAAKDIAELVLDYFPDENGQVRAVEYIKLSSDVQN